MSNSDSTTTPAGANPFGSEIDLGRFGNLPLLDCVNDALRKEIMYRFRQITAAATESALIELLDLVAEPICAAAYWEQQADTAITTILVWFARMMLAKVADGKWITLEFNDSPDSYGSTSARLDLALLARIYASAPFAKYWVARQELAARRAARLRKTESAEQTLRGIEDKLGQLLLEKFPPGTPKPSKPRHRRKKTHIAKGDSAKPQSDSRAAAPPMILNADTPLETAVQRNAAVDAYIEQAQRNGKIIDRNTIRKSCGYHNRTTFEKWQRVDPKSSKPANRRFRNLLLIDQPHLR